MVYWEKNLIDTCWDYVIGIVGFISSIKDVKKTVDLKT